jgi:hypothetical protein
MSAPAINREKRKDWKVEDKESHLKTVKEPTV